MKPDFDHAISKKFALSIVLSPLGESSQLDQITSNVLYNSTRYIQSDTLKLLPEKPSQVIRVYEGQYGFSMTCIPNKRY